MTMKKRTHIIMSKHFSSFLKAISFCAVFPAVAFLPVSCSLDQFGPPNVTRVTITASADSNGTVSVFPAGGKAPVGSEAVVTATANTGYIFIGFFGDIHSTANPLRIMASKNVSVMAKFARSPNLAKMAEIRPAGRTFVMGSQSAMSNSNERPPHLVRLTYGYYMDKCEVTQGLYRSVTGIEPLHGQCHAGDLRRGRQLPGVLRDLVRRGPVLQRAQQD